jgi:hypothetical protein
MKAAYGNAFMCCVLLVKNKATVDTMSKEGRNALMIAADCNHIQVVDFLAETAPGTIDEVDRDGNTALMLAARKCVRFGAVLLDAAEPSPAGATRSLWSTSLPAAPSPTLSTRRVAVAGWRACTAYVRG